MIGFSSNFKLKLRGPNQNQKSSKGRRPPMEDDLKILKVEFLSNHWLDLSQILNLSIGNWTKITCLNGRQPPVEEEPKILKVEFLSNHGSYFLQTWDLIMLEMKTTSHRRGHQNIKSWISQQQQIRFSSNLRLKLRRPNQNPKCS